MKQKFIEGTNKQYSIREDGIVIKHYNNTRGIKSIREKELCIHNGLSTIYMLKKKTTVCISYLLFDYFGFRYCNKCNSKIYIKTFKTCDKCKKEKILKTDRLHYHNNKEAHFKATQNQKNKLADWYVMYSIRIRIKENIPDYIIQAKRKQMLLYREIQKQLKT